LLDLIISCCEKNLEKQNIEWYEKKSLCTVLCSNGYPESYKKNIEIQNFNNLKQDKNNFIFHAGTKIISDKIYAIGGRVLNFVSTSDKFIKSRNQTIEQIKKLSWKNGFYRSDIGHKVINK
jgi:phosphoribosylamine--glycine ligase